MYVSLKYKVLLGMDGRLGYRIVSRVSRLTKILPPLKVQRGEILISL